MTPLLSTVLSELVGPKTFLSLPDVLSILLKDAGKNLHREVSELT